MLTLKDKRKLLEDRLYLIDFEIMASYEKSPTKIREKVLIERTLVLVEEEIEITSKKATLNLLKRRNPAI